MVLIQNFCAGKDKFVLYNGGFIKVTSELSETCFYIVAEYVCTFFSRDRRPEKQTYMERRDTKRSSLDRPEPLEAISFKDSEPVSSEPVVDEDITPCWIRSSPADLYFARSSEVF